MPYCPACKMEFADDVTECPHDKTALVAELPYQTINAEDGTAWVEISSASTADEAELVRGFFESQGIPAQVENLKFSMEPINFGTMGEIRIYVEATNEARAQQLLRERDTAFNRLEDDADTIVTDEGSVAISEESTTEVETEGR